MNSISENISALNERIEKACARSGRNPGEIHVIAVAKTVGADSVLEATKAGIINIGENRVQELNSKFAVLGDICKWHMIGHLQTNKVKQLIDKVDLIHSVDSIDLAQEINKKAASLGKVTKILMQVNISGEESKSGVKPERIFDFAFALSVLGNIKVLGLMTIAPLISDEMTVRPVFSELYKISVDMKHQNIDNVDMDFLSMGMSNDFEFAIEEGSNMIRVGTAIFGKRI